MGFVENIINIIRLVSRHVVGYVSER